MRDLPGMPGTLEVDVPRVRALNRYRSAQAALRHEFGWRAMRWASDLDRLAELLADEQVRAALAAIAEADAAGRPHPQAAVELLRERQLLRPGAVQPPRDERIRRRTWIDSAISYRLRPLMQIVVGKPALFRDLAERMTRARQRGRTVHLAGPVPPALRDHEPAQAFISLAREIALRGWYAEAPYRREAAEAIAAEMDRGRPSMHVLEANLRALGEAPLPTRHGVLHQADTVARAVRNELSLEHLLELADSAQELMQVTQAPSLAFAVELGERSGQMLTNPQPRPRREVPGGAPGLGRRA